MDIVERCSNYLSSGGLFNPEFADHDAVRDLVINCRDEIERLREALKKIVSFEGGNVFDVLHEIHSIAVEALENV